METCAYLNTAASTTAFTGTAQEETDPATEHLQETASSMEGMGSILHICFPQMVWNWDGRYATHY